MMNTETARRDLRPIGYEWGAGPPPGERGPAPLLAILEVGGALEREREQAAIETQDVLSQADEALVMG